MADTSYSFPDDIFATEIPVWMTFLAAPYSTFSQNRTRGYILGNYAADISVPYPTVLSTANTQSYVSGSYPDMEGLFGRREVDIARKEKDNSFTRGLGIVSYDHLETVLTPGARRSHYFEMNLVAKSQSQADAINSIALAFQTYMYPTAFTESVLNMGHPPLWYFFANGYNIDPVRWYWDGNPLVSVLRSVDVNRSPIGRTPFMTPDFTPLAVNIKLQFIELEPAMQLGDGTTGLLSRSERFSSFL